MNRTILKVNVKGDNGRILKSYSRRHPINRYRVQLKKDKIKFTELWTVAGVLSWAMKMEYRDWKFSGGGKKNLFKKDDLVVIFTF